MGISKAALELILQARDEASSVVEGFTGVLGGLGGVAATVATGGMAAAAAGAAAIGAGAVAAGAMVMNFSRDTDEAMRLFQAQTGASVDEMADFEQQAKDVFASGYGEDIGAISAAMATVNLALDDQGDALEESTRRALILRDTFEIDVAEGASAAAAAVTSGLVDSSEEAFDLITSGFQEGLNQAGDFQDTLREYSSDFSRLGFEADGMLGALNAGLEAGAFNTDVIADGVREFGIRFGAAEESATQALDAIGLDSAALYAQYQSGEITVADAMATISSALGGVGDKTLQAQAGAALFGSKWEDIGGDVFIAAGQAQGSIETLAGATDAAGETLNNGLGASIERLKRTALTNLAPLGDIVTDALGKAQPFIDQATLWLGEKLPVGVEWLKDKWDGFFPQARDTVRSFWTGIEPGLTWIREMFDRLSTGVLPHLTEAWSTLQVGWVLVRGVLRDDLMPALQTLRESLGLNSESTGEIMQKIGDFAGTIAVSGIKGLILGISWAIGFVADGAERAARLIDAFKGGLDRLRSTVGWVRDRINELKDALGNLSIPDWLTPGSPTPFELGLRGIGDALGRLPDLDAQFNAGAGGAPMAAAAGSDRINELKDALGNLSIPDWLTPGSPTPFELGLRGIGDALGRLPDLDAQFNVGAGGAPMAAAAGGGAVTQISANFGPGSVRSDDDIETIMNRIQELLNIRGVRTWEV